MDINAYIYINRYVIYDSYFKNLYIDMHYTVNADI